MLSSGSAQAVSICGTPDRIPDFAGQHLPAPTSPMLSLTLTDRDAFSEDANRSYSTRFALKWGSERSVPASQAEELLSHLEMAYDTEVTEWEMPDPTDLEGTYFNVYLGDTGPEVPSVDGMGGYFTLDDEGYPYIVLNREVIDRTNYGKSIIGHEFFHAVQWATGAFSLTWSQRWYWEAGATWAQGVVVPEHDFYYYFLPWYALASASTLEHFSTDEFGGEPPDLHQYGAFIVLQYISEHLDGMEVVLSSWREGHAGEDPLNALDEFLGDVEIQNVLVDQAAANLSWDYADGHGYSSHVDEVYGWFPHRDSRWTSAIADEDDWWTHADSAPDSFGYHYLQMPDGLLDRVWAGEPVAMAVEADIPPGLPSTLDFRARLVVFSGSAATVHEIDNEADQTWLDIDPDADQAWLAVLHATPPHLLRDTPVYRFRWIPQPEDPEDTGDPGDSAEPGDTADTGMDNGDTGPAIPNDPAEPTSAEDAKGCGCTQGGTGSGWMWLFVGALLTTRRGDTQPG